MEFQDAVKSGFNNYANFKGRSSRSAFWFWMLFSFIMNIIATILDSVVGMGLFSLVIGLGLLIPGIAVSVRRLHDTDRSGWWYLLILIPLIGAIVLIVWAVQKGTDGPNQYGDDPLAGLPV